MPLSIALASSEAAPARGFAVFRAAKAIDRGARARGALRVLIELGTGFAFVGSQVPLEVADEDFRLDLLFYLLSPEAQVKPYTITSYDEPEKNAVCYRVQVNHPHVYIFLIASDALQNLRSALDHAVWSLVNLNRPNPDWIQFPIWSERPAGKSEARFMGFLDGLNESYRLHHYIKELQPYNRPIAAVPSPPTFNMCLSAAKRDNPLSFTEAIKLAAFVSNFVSPGNNSVCVKSIAIAA